jgi:hypothetical protein
MKLLKNFKNIPNIDKMLADKYRNSRYSRMVNINGMVKTSNKEMLNNVQNQLFNLQSSIKGTFDEIVKLL